MDEYGLITACMEMNWMPLGEPAYFFLSNRGSTSNGSSHIMVLNEAQMFATQHGRIPLLGQCVPGRYDVE